MENQESIVDTLTPEQQSTIGNVDVMREAFYNVSKNLFEAAKALKPYDILYTDVLLNQAQYFLHLADNPDLLIYVSVVGKEMPLKDLVNKIPNTVQDKIDSYVKGIEEKLQSAPPINIPPAQDTVSDEVKLKIDEYAKAVKEMIKE